MCTFRRNLSIITLLLLLASVFLFESQNSCRLYLNFWILVSRGNFEQDGSFCPGADFSVPRGGSRKAGRNAAGEEIDLRSSFQDSPLQGARRSLQSQRTKGLKFK
jgi:hypothetical protein